MQPNKLTMPILLEPLLLARPWGDQRLAQSLGKPLPPDAPIGESWETGNEARVAHGPLAGTTLQQLVTQYGLSLLGRRGLEASQPFGDFPLLIKFIDANEVLSVQVHPNDDQARPLGQRGKTEAWHILAAEPGAELIVGLCNPLSSEVLRHFLAANRLPEVLARLPVRAGDTVIVPAGTLHAIGPGILLYEIQEQSDITYRFYDWNRVDTTGQTRPLHVDEGLAVLAPGQRARMTQPLALARWRTILTACRYFALERWRLDGEQLLRFPPGETVRILSCISGTLTLTTEQDCSVLLATSQTALVPADVTRLKLRGQAVLLTAFIPDLPEDVIRPLRTAGYDDNTIAQLGGDTSDLLQALAQNPP